MHHDVADCQDVHDFTDICDFLDFLDFLDFPDGAVIRRPVPLRGAHLGGGGLGVPWAPPLGGPIKFFLIVLFFAAIFEWLLNKRKMEEFWPKKGVF